MSPRRRKKRSPKGRSAGSPPLEFWKAVPDLGMPDQIRPARDPSAVVRSLGTPPLTGQTAVAERELAKVLLHAAAAATALAAAAGLLADQVED